MALWRCRNCVQTMQHMGVPSHRAMHRRRKDGPVVMESATRPYRYDFRDQPAGQPTQSNS